MQQYLYLMRMHQWVKNLFIFIPAFFAGAITQPLVLEASLIAFFSFSFASSSIYIINDYVDREKDKQHPTKKNRPLASGKVSPLGAMILLIILLGCATAIAWSLNINSVLILLAYFVMNLAYSFRLKHIAIIDIVIISFGFLMRILIGGTATNIFVSHWLIIIIFLLSLILALGKRRGEFLLEEGQSKTRKSLAGYNQAFIDQSMVTITAVTIVSYIMYCISPEVESRIGSKYVYVTTLFVIMGLMRYLQQTLVYGRTESPTKVLYKDRFIQAVLLLWGATFAFLLYNK